MQFQDIWYDSDDGLKLYARDYANGDAKQTLLCMHGLTRNSADFHDLARELQRDYRIIAVDQRGRGHSDWDNNPRNYMPLRYVKDMFSLIERLKLGNIVLVGTSLGGLMSMMMAGMNPFLFRGVVMNDIGPVMADRGWTRIVSYTGKIESPGTWEAAAEQSRELNVIAFPHYESEDWERWARRNYAEDAAGEVKLLYDPDIAEPLARASRTAPGFDPWALFAGLKQFPVLLIRGGLSDILEADCASEMQRRHPGLKLFTVPGVGHAPMLDEPGVVPLLREFLAEL